MSNRFQAGSSTPSGERWEFRIGAPVSTVDGPFGWVRQVVLDPDEGRIEAIIIRVDTLIPTDLLAPLSAVLDANEESVRIAWSRDEAYRLGQFDESAFHAPTRPIGRFASDEMRVSARSRPANELPIGSWIQPDLPPIRVGLHVSALDGAVGRVDEILVNAATKRATHVIVRRGLVWGHSRRVPVEWVRSVTAEGLALDLTLADFERLPEYHGDDALRQAILETWQEDDGLRPLLSRTLLQLHVRDSIAYLQGYVWSHGNRQHLETLARSVPGVRDVRAELISDDEVPLQVMAALQSDPRTRNVPVYVSCSLGEVRLEGTAPNPEVREAVSEVAATVPRVRVVVNRMLLPGEEPADETPQRNSPLPRVGQPVITHDGPFGNVEHLLLDPRTRRVSGIIVRGNLPVPDRIDPAKHPDHWPREPRMVVIPVEWIEVVSDELLLHAGLRQAASARDYRPGDFPRPNPEWLPPFPYERDEAFLAPVAAPEEPPLPAETAPLVPPEEIGAAGGWPRTRPVLHQGHYVCCSDGPLGVLDHLLIDPRTNEAEYLAVRDEDDTDVFSLVPARWVRAVEEDTVRLQCSRTDLSAIRRYRSPESDAEIAMSVREALSDFLRGPSPLPPVLIRVEQGVVHLSGPVADEMERHLLLTVAGEQPGVREVRDELTTSSAMPQTGMDESTDEDELHDVEPRAQKC